jgi:Spy/CpxP family protein refolding chaperone
MKLSLAPRVQAVVLLLLVATAGALAGIVGERLVTERPDTAALRDAVPTAPGGPWRWEARTDEHYAERLGATLELTAEQKRAIDGIVAEQQERVQELTREVQPRFHAIAEETRNRIEAVMTPEQRTRLRGLREERMRVMRRGELRGPRDDGVRPRGLWQNGPRDSIMRGDTAWHRPERQRMGPGRGMMQADTIPDRET